MFRYLKGTQLKKLEFRKGGHAQIEGFTNADWAGKSDNPRSVTRFVFIMQGAAVPWSSRKQRTVALLTTEAEYMALFEAYQVALWLRELLQELDPMVVIQPLKLSCDNKGAIALAQASGYR